MPQTQQTAVDSPSMTGAGTFFLGFERRRFVCLYDQSVFLEVSRKSIIVACLKKKYSSNHKVFGDLSMTLILTLPLLTSRALVAVEDSELASMMFFCFPRVLVHSNKPIIKKVSNYRHHSQAV